MAISLKKTEEAYQILKDYDGENPYIITLKNNVYAYKIAQLNDFQAEFILRNYNKKPILINKVVKVATWWGEKKKEEWNIDFIPKKLVIGWYIGDTSTTYIFYAKYRQSVEAKMMFVPKSAILTDFLLEDWTKKEIDFSPYNKRSGRTLYPHQEDAVKFLVTRKKAILADQMGLGKMEPVSSLLPTPSGYKRMGDIKVGDKVFGSDGKEHNVIGVFPHKNKPIYKVTFTDNSFCRCGMEHLWIVRTVNDVRRNRGWKVKSLEEIVKSGLEWKGSKSHNYKYEIPIAEPINYNAVEHLIHPYILGICIGDGNMCNGGINISIPDFEKETSVKIKSLLKEGYTLSEDRIASCPRYRIVKPQGTIKNEYIREIKRLKLNVHGNYKFIPDEYKIDSISNRIELLRGLMDSDGYISKTKNHIIYNTNSKRLANDVAELVTSLGGIGRVHHYERERNGRHITEYMVFIQIKINPFSLKRKADRYNPTFKKYCVRKIKSVEYDGNEDAQCIAVDSEDHSYVTSKFHIVTHNTVSAIVAALAGGYKHILVVCPASVKETWKNELKNYVDEKDIAIVNGSKWDDAKFTIINYDVLDSYYEIPTQKIKKKELNVDDDGNIVTEVKEKEIVSRNTQIISDAMDKSQLYKSNFDLFIIDEAHRLSNSSSGRFKIIKDLLKRSKPEGIFELTGTMITNGAHNLYNLLKIIGCRVTDNWEDYMTKYCGAKVFYKKGPRTAYTNIFLKQHGKNTWADLTYDEKRHLDEYLEKKCPKIIVPGEDTNMDELQEIIKPFYLRRVTDDLKHMVEKRVKFLHYTLSPEEEISYSNVWKDYQNQLETEKDVENSEKYKKLIEGSILRQWLADKMIPRTISLVNKCIEKNHKVIIFCAYDNEINTFKEAFKGISVFHNGKISLKKKNDAVEQFQNNDNIKVFIGNIQSASVGLTLTAGDVVVFNNFSFTPSDNLQAENRIHRLSQTKPCTVYYQSFNGTYFDHMLEIVRGKQNVIDQIIVSEKEK